MPAIDVRPEPGLASLPASVVTSSHPTHPQVNDEIIWLQDYGADNTGATYSDAAFASAIAAAATFNRNGQGGGGRISGLAGDYKLGQYASLAIPTNVAFGNFGGGAKGAARFWFPNETNHPTALGMVNGTVNGTDTTLALKNVKGVFAPPGGHPQPVLGYAGNVLTYTGITGSGASVTLTGVAGITSGNAAALSNNLVVGNTAILAGGNIGTEWCLDRTIEVWGPNGGSRAGWVPGSTLNGSATLPQATIPLVSTAGFPTGGGQVMLTGTFQVITYTGVSGNSLTGCTGGTGTIASGTSAVYITPPTAMDGIYVASNCRIDCTVGGFRHATVMAGDHEQWGPNFRPLNSYSYIAVEAPAQAAYVAYDSGDQLIHKGVDMHGAYFASVYVTAFNHLVDAEFEGGNSWGFSPFGFWKEATLGVTGADSALLSGGRLTDIAFESIGLSLFGCPDGNAGINNNCVITNPTMSWGASAPAGAPAPLAEFAINLNVVTIVGGDNAFWGGAPGSYPNTPVFAADIVMGTLDHTPYPLIARAVIATFPALINPKPMYYLKFRGGKVINVQADIGTPTLGDLIETTGIYASSYPWSFSSQLFSGARVPAGVVVSAYANQVCAVATSIDYGKSVMVNVHTNGDITGDTYVRYSGGTNYGKAKSATGLADTTALIFARALGADSAGQAPVLISPPMQ